MSAVWHQQNTGMPWLVFTGKALPLALLLGGMVLLAGCGGSSDSSGSDSDKLEQ